MKNKIKILFITPSFTKGGAEKNMLNVINSLNSNDFDITLIICTNQKAYTGLLNKKINIIVLDKKGIKSALFDIIKLINKIKPNILFTSAPHVSVPLIFYKKIFMPQLVKITRIPTLPSNNLGNKNLKSFLLKKLNTKIISLSTYIIAQSKQMQDEIIKYYNCDSSKVKLINNIVDVDTIKEKAEEPLDYKKDGYTYLACGSLYSVKGFDYLIKAFANHILIDSESKLLILGEEAIEKGYKKYLENLIIDLNLNERVFLLGHQNNPYKYYKMADAFVLSSIKEGFPNVVIENLVLNKPILVTDCIDFTSIINSKNGVIVQKESVKALEKGLIEIKNIKKSNTIIRNFDFNNWFKNIIR